MRIGRLERRYVLFQENDNTDFFLYAMVRSTNLCMYVPLTNKGIDEYVPNFQLKSTFSIAVALLWFFKWLIDVRKGGRRFIAPLIGKRLADGGYKHRMQGYWNKNKLELVNETEEVWQTLMERRFDFVADAGQAKSKRARI